MPRIIKTPESILRQTGTDLYFLRFHDGLAAYRAGAEPCGKTELEAWLRTHLPETALELIGPSEFSGLICGGIGNDYAFAATEEAIAVFSKRWEDEQGCSLDPRWQCYWYPISEYEKRVALHGDPTSWAA